MNTDPDPDSKSWEKFANMIAGPLLSALLGGQGSLDQKLQFTYP
jgi:hypothetical protein